MKAQYQSTIEKVQAWHKLWTPRLGLEHWIVEVAFLDSFYPMDFGSENFQVSATTEGRWNYYEAKVIYYLPSVVRHDDSHLERVVVHELCHILLMVEQSIVETLRNLGTVEGEAAAEVAQEKIEAATEMTSRAFFKAWNPDVEMT